MQKEIEEQIEQLINKQQSLLLSTVISNVDDNTEQQAFSSYAPYSYNLTNKEFYVLLSDLAGHTQHLIKNPHASILIIEDESDSEEIFARTRVQYQVQAEIMIDENKKEQVLKQLKQRFGEIIDVLTGLTDFRLFQLSVIEGRFVKGFGQAFDLEGIAGDIKHTMLNKR